MERLNAYERIACAQQFLKNSLTAREQDIVVAFALGFSQADLARAWRVSPPAISQMVSRIHRKAQQYWV